MRPVILLTGKNGQIGWELLRFLPQLGEVVALDRNQLDLSRQEDPQGSRSELTRFTMAR
jgi:dTDP-4-dehydrorhamnose reductase